MSLRFIISILLKDLKLIKNSKLVIINNYQRECEKVETYKII